MPVGSISTTSVENSLKSTSGESGKPSYWEHMVSHYEKRNASLEQKQLELAERIRLMECAVPSLLMGAMVSMKRNNDPRAKSSSTQKRGKQTSVPVGKQEAVEMINFEKTGSTGLRDGRGKPEVNRF